MDTDNSQTRSRRRTPVKCPARSEATKLSQVKMIEGASEVKGIIHQAAKGKVGQPTKFTPERWEAILEAVATYQDLIEICAQPGMPSVSAIYKWMRADPKLKDDLRAAWEMSTMLGKSYNENVLRGGIMSTGDFRRDEALVAHNKWLMGKTNRRDFGDNIKVEITEHRAFLIPGDIIDGETF